MNSVLICIPGDIKPNIGRCRIKSGISAGSNPDRIIVETFGVSLRIEGCGIYADKRLPRVRASSRVIVIELPIGIAVFVRAARVHEVTPGIQFVAENE